MIATIIIVYCLLSFYFVGSALNDTYGGKTKLWVLWLPLSPLLLFLFLVGSQMHK